MMPRRPAPFQVISDPRPPPLLPNAVLGMLIFVLTEIMLFAGMVSAFSIARASSLLGWPPPGQPRLPFEETAVNTVALLLSGLLLFHAGRVFQREQRRAEGPLLVALALALFFLLFQGIEWLALLREGLTLQSSQHGAFFYLIVGTHALHALAAVVALLMVWRRLRQRRLRDDTFQAVRVFWYFVVLVWPALYLLVYR